MHLLEPIDRICIDVPFLLWSDIHGICSIGSHCLIGVLIYQVEAFEVSGI